MAGIMKRGGMWYAVYKVNGRTVQKSLKSPILTLSRSYF